MSHQSDTDDSLLPSLLASVVVHGLIVAGIILAYHFKPLPEVVAMEASLVSGDDLAGIQAQIADAYAKNQAASQIQTAPAQATPAPSPAMTDYNQELSEREQAYQAQMDAYAEALDQEIFSEIQMHKQALEEQDKERERQVKELENKERSNDEIAKENSKELSQAKERIAQEAKKAQAQSQSQSQASSGADDGDDAPTTPTAGNGGGATSGGTSGNSRSTNIVGALQAHIKRYWKPTGSNTTLNVRLSVDENGNVLSVSVSGGTEHLQSALEDTIRQASPLTPIQGTSYRNLNFAFHIN